MYFKKTYLQALALFILALSTYLLTWNRSFVGYEPDTVDAAVALTHGQYLLKKPGIGSSLMYVPFVYLVKLLPTASATKALTLVPPLYSALVVVVLFFIIDALGAKRSTALLVAASIGLGSLLWPYSRIGMEYQETLFIGLIILAILKWQQRKTSPLVVGLLLAMLALIKSYGCVFVLPALVMTYLSFKKEERRKFFSLSFLSQIIVPTVVVVAYLMGVNFLFKGRVSGAYGLAFEFVSIHWWEGMWGTFFGAGKSILLYSPLLILSAWYWPRFFKSNKPVGAFILIGFGLLFVITTPFRFWSDETLSVRKLVPIIPYLHLPLLLLVEDTVNQKLKWKKYALALCVAAAIGIEFLCSLYPYGRYLLFLRAGNLDTFEQMRYNPVASPLYVHYRFLMSFINTRVLHRADRAFEYTELTWMRCCLAPRGQDTAMIDFKADLSKYNEPSSYIITGENKVAKRLYAVVVLLLLGFSGVSLLNTAQKLRKKE